MAEWHVPFDHIENRWTERQFQMMVYRHNERKRRQARAAQAGPSGDGFRPYCEV